MSDRRDNQEVRRFRVNFRFSIALIALVALSGLGIYLAGEGSEQRMSREAIGAAQRLLDAGNTDLAVRHLSQHLAIRPIDAAALELKSRILARTAQTGDQIYEAARVHEQLLRLAPKASYSQDVRRRLVSLDVRYSDIVRNEPISNQFMNELYARAVRYRAAEVVARDLIEKGGREPGDYLLLALALDGMAVPGDREALVGAVAQYRNVLTMTPADLTAADRLAKIYQERLKDPARAEQVLDDLIKAAPRSVEARLIRHRLFVKLHRPDKAAVELDEAAKLDPTERELTDLMVSSAEFALRRGDVMEARRQLARVPEKYRDDVRTVMVKGLIDFEEEQPDDAIDAWRRGLEVVGGSDADLSWWLAYALFQMNRVNDAIPLVKQYQRFASNEDPKLRFLEALLYERTGRPSRALAILESIPQRIDNRYEGLIALARGRCSEALWDESKAQDAYSAALKIDPSSVVARLALAKLKLRKRPDEALNEIERGLRLDPENPALRIALAGVRLRFESAKPVARRLWDDFDRDWHSAVEKSPTNSALALMWADRLSLAGKEQDAVKFLEEAVAKSPKSAAVSVALAHGFLRLGKPEKAREVLNLAMTANGAGDQAGLRIARAAALTAQYQGREARKTLIDNVGRLPLSEQILVWMTAGQLDTARGDLAAARADYERWTEINANDPRPLLVLLELELNDGNEPKIRENVEKLLKLARESIRLTGEARELAAKTDLTYMIARAKELLWQADNPNLVEIFGSEAGRVKLEDAAKSKRLEAERSKKIAEAAKLSDSIVFEAPELPASQMLRARVLEKQDKLDDAIASYMKVWERGNEAALPRIIKLLGQRRRYDMIAKLRESNESAKTQVDLFSAQIFLRVGDRTQAGRIAEQLALDLNGSGEALGWKARMLDHLGRIDDAEDVLRALAERQPSVAEPWLALIRSQAKRKRTEALEATVNRAKAAIQTDRREFLEARIARASQDTLGAANAFEEANRKYPDDLLVRLEAAEFHKENKEYRKAEKYLRSALKLAPEDRRVLRQLASVLALRAYETEDGELWREAWETLGPVGVETKAEPDDRFARAIVLAYAPKTVNVPKLSSTDSAAVVSGRGQAIVLLEQLIEDLPLGQPTGTDARKFLATLQTEARGTDDGKSDADKAKQSESAEKAIQPVAAAGTDPTAIALYAQVLIQSKKIEAAEWQLDRLAALSPGDPREAYLRARLIYNRSRPVESAQALEQAYSIRQNDPGSEPLGREAFNLLADANPSDPSALKLAEGLARQNPACSWMPAQIYAGRGRIDEAFELLKTAAKSESRLDDRSATARVALIIVTNTPDSITIAKAEAILETLLQADPDADVLNIMMAMLRHVQGKYVEEVRLYRKALERRPEDYIILNNLAWVLCEGLQEYDEALVLANKLVKIHGESDILVKDTRGVIHTRLGQKDPAKLAAAIADLEVVVKKKPTPLHMLHLARAYKLSGSPEDAKKSRELVREVVGEPSLEDAGKPRLSPRDIDPAEREEILGMLKR